MIAKQGEGEVTETTHTSVTSLSGYTDCKMLYRLKTRLFQPFLDLHAPAWMAITDKGKDKQTTEEYGLMRPTQPTKLTKNLILLRRINAHQIIHHQTERGVQG